MHPPGLNAVRLLDMGSGRKIGAGVAGLSVTLCGGKEGTGLSVTWGGGKEGTVAVSRSNKDVEDWGSCGADLFLLRGFEKVRKDPISPRIRFLMSDRGSGASICLCTAGRDKSSDASTSSGLMVE